MAAIWLAQSDLENATSVEDVLAIFDDTNSGAVNLAAIAQVINSAEQEVLSWLVGEYGPAPMSAQTLAELAADPFLKSAALEFAKWFMFDRKPEYVRSSPSSQTERWDRATARMERIANARQRPPTVVVKPANVGGIFHPGQQTIYTPNPDGTPNSGDF